MSGQSNQSNMYSEANTNNFWLTRPPPPFMPSRPIQPMYNIHNIPFIHPPLSPCNKPAQNYFMPYGVDISNQYYQEQYVPSNQNISNSFSSLPDNIDEEYILQYLCPIPKTLKDETTIWIEKWLATKEKDFTIKNVKSTNVIEINQISNIVKECKQLLENMNNNKKNMEQNVLTMTEAEWKKACSNLILDKKQIDTMITTLHFDAESLSELKFRLAKRKKKRDRLKRLKANLKLIKSQKKDEILEINRKIDAWQNALKENILKEERVNKTKTEANIVLKGVRGKIEDAKNQLSLLDNLEKLRKCRLQNCVNKRRNPLLENALNKLKILWQQKLADYNKEEEGLKNMLIEAEAKKKNKREIEIQEKLAEWDHILFGPSFRSHEMGVDNYTFLEIRRGWDKYVVDEKEVSASSSIPLGWILPLEPCNNDWAKYSNNVNVL
ncbi:programmed cell death protein 7 [Rhopalosiphum padi]|uniref:programmed cell death protein 7 n=1 Tax=Rhopalosiphum padi TaxID=40932 RepID=UPI00298D9BC2|nr:programmed cell death protein 7 [Rhopalosiphum padi]